MKQKKKHQPLPAGGEPAIPGNGWLAAGICFFLAALVWLVFGRTSGFGFINYDDNSYVYSNAAVTQGLTLKGVAAAFSCQATDNWVPLTTLSHMVDCQFYGLNAGGHHLMNVLLHMATVILLFLVLWSLTAAVWRSALVAAVFAIHPLRVESVAWVSERKDVLSGLFFMLTLWAYVRYVRRSGRLVDYLLVLFLFALGLMSKPVLVTLPVILLLLDYWPLKRFSTPAPSAANTGAGWWGNLSVPARLIIEKIPLLVLSLVSCIPTLLAEKPGIQTVQNFPLPLRIENALVSCVIYIGQMFYPARLAVFYPYPANGLPVWEIAGALLVLAAISVAVFFGRRERPYLFVGWWWYLVMLVPVIGLVQVGGQARADRHTYLSHIGLYVLLVWLAADLAGRMRYRVWAVAGGSVIMLSALIWCARAQTAYWVNTETLQAHTLDCTGDNAVARNCLGLDLFDKGRVDEAIAQYRAAVRISPRYDDAHNNLGNALLQKGDVDGAISQYQEALSINPGLAGAHYNLGNALRQQGRGDEAIAEYQAALKLDPTMAKACNNLGLALAQKGQMDDAILQYRRALEIDPRYADACDNLGDALAQTGQAQDAAAEFQEALKLDPNNVEAHNNLGNLFGQAGQVDDAISQYQAALKLDPDYANAHVGLGTVLLQKRQWNDAVTQYLDALKLQPRNAMFQNTFARLVWALITSQDPSLRNGINAVELVHNASELAGGNNPIILRVLAAAEATHGDFPGAMETAKRALALAQQNPALAQALQQEIARYQSGYIIQSDGPMNMAEWQ